MAKAYKCDRCGKLYVEEVRSDSNLYICKYDCFCMRPLDVCPLCMGGFEAWWQSGRPEKEEEDG